MGRGWDGDGHHAVPRHNMLITDYRLDGVGEGMKYKIAICDDSGADRQFVLNMVRAWASSAGHTVHIDDFPSAESFLFRYAEESDYDILLLDIEMGAMDGVTMAKELRKSNDTVQIIFITGYSDYISEGYEVAALHYLANADGAAGKSRRLCRISAAVLPLEPLFDPAGGADRRSRLLRFPLHQ